MQTIQNTIQFQHFGLIGFAKIKTDLKKYNFMKASIHGTGFVTENWGTLFNKPNVPIRMLKLVNIFCWQVKAIFD